MFKPTKATTVKDYMAFVPDDRREAMEFLHTFIQKTAPSLKPHFAYNMLGYGSFPYKNYKNEMVEWPTIALANQKQYMSLYVCCVIDGQYVAESYKRDLGKVSVGKSCIRFKKLSDLNIETLSKVIKIAAKHPGLVGVGASKKA